MYTIGCKNKVYLANKMTGIPYFNAPWFDSSAAVLRSLPSVGEVFNPADHDRQMGFKPDKCPYGEPQEMTVQGFDPRLALKADYNWICEFSDALIVGKRWPDSPGTISEIAVHQALGLPAWELNVFLANWAHDNLYEQAIPPIMRLGSYGSLIDR